MKLYKFLIVALVLSASMTPAMATHPKKSLSNPARLIVDKVEESKFSEYCGSRRQVISAVNGALRKGGIGRELVRFGNYAQAELVGFAREAGRYVGHRCLSK